MDFGERDAFKEIGLASVLFVGALVRICYNNF